MKLLTVTIDFPPMTGGVARYTEALCQYFGSNMTVVTNVPGATDNAPYTRVNYKLFTSGWPAWRRTHKILESYESDMVMIQHVLPLGIVAARHKKATGVPYTVFLHGMDFLLATRNPWKRMVTKYVLRNAHTVVTTTRALQADVQAFCKRDAIVVPPMPGIQATEAVSHRTGSTCQLITVGRLVERKGIQRVLKTLANNPDLKKRAHYTIIGSGPMEAQLRTQVEAQELQDVVTFITDATDEQIASHYAASDVFVMPTLTTTKDKEGFGIVYLEAATFGLPSIASEVPGVDEAVLHEQTGLLVSDDAELKQALEQMIFNTDARIALGDKAKRRVENDFTPDKVYAPLVKRFGL